MTRREQKIFNDDVQRRFEELVEHQQNGEEALEGHSDEDLMRIAVDDAKSAYDDHCDSKMEDKREKDWE